ncbi:MAG: glycosyltransferase [Paludibacter sp.]|nr:glycosyltransferase [Paludibacter sp.]
MNRVTVLLPVYNGAEFLAETIDSVLNQTYADFNFLIINDASTDNSEEIILSYTDLRIQYLVNEKNLGSIGSPQKGMDIIQTEYIARIDQDDLWQSTKLKKQMDLLDSNPQIGLCGTSIELIGDISGIRIFPISNEPLKVGFLFGCFMSHPSVVFRKSFLVESGLRYSPEYYLADDYKMWIDCLNYTEIYNIPEPLVSYRQHQSQICSVHAPEQLVVKNRVRLEMLERIYPNPTEEEKEFHLQIFSEQNIQSIADYRKCIEWKKTLQLHNKLYGYYIQPHILYKELDKYMQAGYKGYVLSRYFQKFSMSNGLKYILSFDWRYLSLRRNASLLFKCIF